MKLKYYLRGIGLGMLIVFVLYSAIVMPKYKLTDEEILKRADEIRNREAQDVDLSALSGTPTPEGDSKNPSETPSETPSENPSETPSGTPSEPPISPDGPDEPKGPGEAEVSEPTPGGTGATGEGMPTGAADSPGMTEPKLPESGMAAGMPSPGATGMPENPTLGVTEPAKPQWSLKDGKALLVIPRGMDSGAFAFMAQESGLVGDAKEFDKYLMENGYSKEIREGTYLILIGSSYQEIADRVTNRKK